MECTGVRRRSGSRVRRRGVRTLPRTGRRGPHHGWNDEGARLFGWAASEDRHALALPGAGAQARCERPQYPRSARRAAALHPAPADYRPYERHSAERGRAGYETLARTESFTRAYSRLSTSACRLASTMLSCTPTVPHSVVPSLDSISTRVRAAVPLFESMMRTL